MAIDAKMSLLSKAEKKRRVSRQRPLSCLFCIDHLRIDYGSRKGKFICKPKPMYVLDRFTRKRPKWCPKKKWGEN